MDRFSLADLDLRNKTVLLRVDYNVPIEKGIIKDSSKVKASLSTIKYLLEKNCKIVLATHLGRPEGKIIAEWKVDPLAEKLQKYLPKNKIIKLNDCIGSEVKEKIQEGKQKTIFLLENLRFYIEEEENNPAFAHSLAELAEVYVNDAFAVCHRKHASVDGVTNFLPSITGQLLEQERWHLSKALYPRRPAVWILGGAKLDKVELIKQALKKADKILIGGALAFSFLNAKGIKVGMSKVDPDSVNNAKKILSKWSAKKIILPLDFKVVEKLNYRAESKIVNYRQISPYQNALDIGPKTIALFKHHLNTAKTIFWNGPLGYFEWANFAMGTKEIGRFLGKINAVKIAGGGETAEAINKFQLAHHFTHISTGGGATIQFLSGKEMPGIAALERNYKKFRKKVK